MMQIWRLCTVVAVALWVPFNLAPVWAQTAPNTELNESKKQVTGERTGEEKMEARGTEQPDRMERKKGEEEMEARGAQKPGRMGKSGASGMEAGGGERRSMQEIKKAQQALMDKGHNPGSVDGIMGPQTRAAIKAFQSANGLKETGQLDAETSAKLTAPGK
jgi:hypothetical protein